MNDTLDFLKMLQNMITMYTQGEDKRNLFDNLLVHLTNLTGSTMGVIAQLIKKDGKKFHEFVAYKLDSDKFSDGMKQYVDRMGGYYISTGDERSHSLLARTYNSNEYVIQNEIDVDYSKLPKGHFKIENFLGIPLRIQGIQYGMICLANREIDNQSCDYEDSTYDIIKPFGELCGLLLHSFQLSTLKSIYERIVHNMSDPMVVYKGVCSYKEGMNIEDIINEYRCIIINKAFCERTCPVDTQVFDRVKDHTLFESFPGFKMSVQILDKIKKMFLTKESQSINCIEFEDYLFTKSQYQFKFCYVDDTTFIMSFDDISDKIKAKQIAENTVKSKEEFIANISHEMRTPLNGIIGYTALIRDTPLNEYQKDCFGAIRECSMNLLYRVNDLLDLSKLTAGKMELHEEDFSLPDCISASHDVSSLDAKDKKIDVAYFIEPDVPNIIKGDAHKLQQILINLLTNAIKFTDGGKINTHVRLIDDTSTRQKIDVRGRYTIEFTVSDTGIGIEQENIEELFTPFTQIHSKDRVNDGTGLGLVITKKLCELLGGNIRVESIFGKGSKFIFYIKVKGNDVVQISSAQEKQILGKKKIMVVDDNEMNRVMICSFLNDWGMIPISFSSAKEALFYVDKDIINFDLALLDIKMPHKDGNQLATEIYQKNNKLPLVAISSVLLPSHKINKRFKFYLTKPVKRKKLKQICLDIFRSPSPTQTEEIIEDVGKCHSPVLEKMVRRPMSQSSTGYFKIPRPNLDNKSKRAKIILAEDLFINQQVTIQILQKLGYKNIELAENGKELLDKIQLSTQDYDIILMDLKMPVMNGFEAAIAIDDLYNTFEYTHRKKPKIMAVTARVMSGVKERCIETGMSDYITKPMQIQVLNQKIQNLLDGE